MAKFLFEPVMVVSPPPLTPAFGRSKKDQEFKVSFSYMRLCLKNKQKPSKRLGK